MKTGLEKHDEMLIINQRLHSRISILLIGAAGILLFVISIFVILAAAGDIQGNSARSVFTSAMLTGHFLLALGTAMITVGFSKNSVKNYSEKITFNNASESIEFAGSSYVAAPYIIPYPQISHLQTWKNPGGPDNPDLFSLAVIRNDGSSFWITGYQSDPEKLKKLSAEIADHTGFEIRDISSIGTERPGLKKYSHAGTKSYDSRPEFIEHIVNTGSESIAVKSARQSLLNLASTIIILSLFFTVPVYILNIYITPETPAIVTVITKIFAVLWSIILLIMFLVSMKKYRITISQVSLEVTLSLKLFPFVKYSLSIPRDVIISVRTNRIENCAVTLSLGVNEFFRQIKSAGVRFMNLSLYRNYKSPVLKKLRDNEITLWEIMPCYAPGKGPGIFEIVYIEQLIQQKLGIKEG